MTRAPLARLLALALACSGCSYAFMRPPPEHHERLRYVDCTSSRLAPIADGVGAVEGVATALMIEAFAHGAWTGHGDPDGDDGVDGSARAAQVVALGVAGVYVASSIYGFGTASECEDAKALAYQRQLDAPPSAPAGCASDLECKAGRICLEGACVWPANAPLSPPPASPARAP